MEKVKKKTMERSVVTRGQRGGRGEMIRLTMEEF
jgi:hypothetical protein